MITRTLPWLENSESLLCFGDSITANTKGYVALLSTRLALRNVTVINAGRGGDKTPWALTRLESEVIASKPSAVSIFLGTNDCAVGRGEWADEPVVSVEQYRSNLVWIVHLCRLAGIKKFSITPPLWRPEGLAWHKFGDAMTPYCRAAREAADTSGAWLVPADTAFADAWAQKPGHTGLLLTTDGIHLNPQGNELLAETMLSTWGCA